MGGIVDSVTDVFFGDDEQVPAQQTGSASTMTPEQEKLLKTILGVAQTGIEEGGSFYGGKRVADPSNLQNLAFNKIFKLLSGSNIQGAMGDVLTRPDASTFDQSEVNDFYQKAIYDPAMKTFMDETAPAIQEKFVSQNALESGGFNRALTKAMGDMTTDTTGQMANILYNSREAQKGRDFSANQNYLNRALTSTNLLTNLGLSAGDTKRDILQEILTGNMQAFNEKQDYNNPYLQLALSLLDKKAFSPIVSGSYYEDNPGLFDFAKGGIDLFSGISGLF